MTVGYFGIESGRCQLQSQMCGLCISSFSHTAPVRSSQGSGDPSLQIRDLDCQPLQEGFMGSQGCGPQMSVDLCLPVPLKVSPVVNTNGKRRVSHTKGGTSNLTPSVSLGCDLCLQKKSENLTCLKNFHRFWIPQLFTTWSLLVVNTDNWYMVSVCLIIVML